MKRLIDGIIPRLRDVPDFLSPDLADFVSSYLTEQQRQLPGRWQHWTIEKREKEIAAELNAAFLAREYSFGRIIERFAR